MLTSRPLNPIAIQGRAVRISEVKESIIGVRWNKLTSQVAGPVSQRGDRLILDVGSFIGVNGELRSQSHPVEKKEKKEATKNESQN